MPGPHPDAPPLGPAYLPDGSEVLVRTIGPDDGVLLELFHEGLSDRSVAMRYFHHLALRERINPDRLRRICLFDRDRELVLVVEAKGPAILGVGRWNRLEAPDEAEMAVIVADRAHRQGVGSLMVRRLLAATRSAGLRRLIAIVHPENVEMLDLCRKFGHLDEMMEDGAIMATFAV